MKPWKVQKLFGDIVWDLRNRGLLPIAALLVVGIVVVPVLISRSSDQSSAPPASLTSEHVSAPEAESAVVAYNPGVRNYRKRLKSLQAADPFKQQFTGSTAPDSALGEGYHRHEPCRRF